MRACLRIPAYLASLLFLAGPTFAQEMSSVASADIVTAAWADPAKCNLANAARVDLVEVIRDVAALKGKCVSVEGFWVGNGLFLRAADANRPWASLDSTLQARKVGIYAHRKTLARAPRRAVRYTMVGSVGQCETQWPGATMIQGYCHSNGGPILLVAKALPVKRKR